MTTNKLEDMASTLTGTEFRLMRAEMNNIDKERELEAAFWREIESLIDKEIAENQIIAADIEAFDAQRQFAVLTVWRRPMQGDHVDEIRSLVNRGKDGDLHCRIIKRSEWT